MKITVKTVVRAPLEKVWSTWVTPHDICQWNAASDDWHTPSATVDLREGGQFTARMEARDGSFGFDFGGTYTLVQPYTRIGFRMSDGREVLVVFEEQPDGVTITETFDAETIHSPELQRSGWQAILDRFAGYVAGKVSRA